MKEYSHKVRGKFIWDPWFIQEQGVYHVFYLQAKRTKSYRKRHDDRVSVGHAVSSDLVKWKTQRVALKPAGKGWDDLAIWTGSVIKKGRTFYLFYTGRDKKTRSQKIGVALSKNLTTWEKYSDNPLLEMDPQYYEITCKTNKLGKGCAWRDPFVFFDKKLKKYYMTLSARHNDKRKEYDGCIGLAESRDLLTWKVLPPIFYPRTYDEMEVSQVIQQDGKYYLFFSVPYVKSYSERLKKNLVGLHCYVSTSLRGKYKPVNGNGLVVGGGGEIYGYNLIKKGKNTYSAIGFLRMVNGKYIAKLSMPIEIKIDGMNVSVV